MHAEIAEGHRLLHVDLARPPVVPQPVRHVGILLDLAEHDPRADGMHRVRRNQIRLARPHRCPAQQMLHLARARGLPQPLAREGLAEPHGDGGPRRRLQDVPHLGLAARPTLAVIGMHLHGKPLIREDQLHQQRQFARAQEPRLSDRRFRIRKPRHQARLAPHAFAQGGREADRLFHI